MIEVAHIGGNATLFYGDCMEILPTLGGVSAVVTDPPYGIDFTQRTTGEKITGDDKPFDPSPFLGIGEEQLFWGAENFASRLDRGRWLVWIKRAVEVASPKSYGDCELAWHSNAGCIKAHRQISDGCIRQGEEHGHVRVHPSQKPVALMQWCLSFVKPGLIFDPFMGSGSTGVACARMGLPFVGAEIERKYFDVACERISAEHAQGKLFSDETHEIK